jgi:hypothetical protein
MRGANAKTLFDVRGRAFALGLRRALFFRSGQSAREASATKRRREIRSGGRFRAARSELSDIRLPNQCLDVDAEEGEASEPAASSNSTSTPYTIPTAGPNRPGTSGNACSVAPLINAIGM